MSIDVLSIGDLVVEPFIKLKDARVHCNVNDETCEICMKWGDKIPYESAEIMPAVGNSANAAVACARLGLKSTLRAYVGADSNGKACIDRLKQEGVDTRFVVTDKTHETNRHYVLWYETERTILVNHQEYPYALPRMMIPPKWIYLSSLAPHSMPYHEEILAYLDKNPRVKLAYQPGTFQMSLPEPLATKLYKRSDTFFCNKDEAKRILNEPHDKDIKDLLTKLQQRGPKVVVISDDRQGAYAHDGDHYHYVPMYPDVRAPFERTGAGDSFASTITAALALGKPLHEALLWGPINAMSVVQSVGAQKGLLTRAELLDYLQKAPPEYKLTSL